MDFIKTIDEGFNNYFVSQGISVPNEQDTELIKASMSVDFKSGSMLMASLLMSVLEQYGYNTDPEQHVMFFTLKDYVDEQTDQLEILIKGMNS